MRNLIPLTILFTWFSLATHASDKVTAREFYPKADSIAMNYLNSPCLTDVISEDVDSMGQSEYWIFRHDSLSIYISYDSINVEPNDMYNYTGWSKISDTWINSDSAISIAEKHGGQSFRKTHPQTSISAKLLGDSAIPFPVWLVSYVSETETWQIELNALDGSVFRETGIRDKIERDKKYLLLKNYPNPFNATTTISFQLPEPDVVSLKIYNIKGQLLETLIDEFKLQGRFHIKWQADHYASGLYLYQIKTSRETKTNKLLLSK